ncbi:GNAT family N-acetyltransferase [Simiduia agarivorans]|uniref:Formyl transferase domain protein n=1 Tax=Simiduia agarivorans (strain DSM 21679 / JCM 13881 / BCRC 17597 / SA1) TaxID=1117647 RepID=K4KLM9_SIMAS|nr:GNAT family N-acetyltransferase [Simiduia agarivorans]AFU98978.1 formyl transferase domain protein [Simiduia agarivorans SA1 = DSM 21679]
MTAFRELRQTHRNYGLLAVATDIINRIGYRFGITHVEKIFVIEELARTSEFSANVLSADEIKHLQQQGMITCDPEQITAAECGQLICIAATEQDRLCGLTWYAIQPYRYGGSTFAFFDPRYICGFGAFVHPDYRGRGVRDAIVAKAIEHANSLGRRGIIAAISWTNFASLRSAARIGYKAIGLAYCCPWLPSHRHRPYYQLRKLETTTPITTAFISTSVSAVLELLYRKSILLLVIDAAPKRPTSQNPLRRILARTQHQSVSDWAYARGVPCIRFLSDNQSTTAEAIRASHADYLISYTAPLFNEEILLAPKKAAVNIHPSLLPDYRGGAPLPWQVLREEAITGASLHLLTMKIDQGAVLAQVQSELPAGLSKKALFELARNNAARALDTWLDKHLSDSLLSGVAQPEQSDTPFARNRTLADLNRELDWHQDSTAKLFALARYLERWPTELNQPPGLLPWLPWRACSLEESCSNLHSVQWRYSWKGLQFRNAKGQITLRPSLNPLHWLSHWRNWRRLAREQGENIYL